MYNSIKKDQKKELVFPRNGSTFFVEENKTVKILKRKDQKTKKGKNPTKFYLGSFDGAGKWLKYVSSLKPLNEKAKSGILEGALFRFDDRKAVYNMKLLDNEVMVFKDRNKGDVKDVF